MSRRQFGCFVRLHEGPRGAAALAAAGVILWCGEAEAYRPFDGTDAAVVETGEMEIELGPVEALRVGAERTLLAPDLRINYGFIPRWEAALEGRLTHGLTAGIPGTSLVESQVLLKGVLREGTLQEKPGPSIATEFGVLLPGINDQHGTGAVLNGIVRTAGTGERLTSTRKLSSLASSIPITFWTASSRVRMTGPCDPSPNSSTRAMLACFEPAPPWSGQSGRSKIMLPLTLGYAARASMARLPARSARA